MRAKARGGKRPMSLVSQIAAPARSCTNGGDQHHQHVGNRPDRPVGLLLSILAGALADPGHAGRPRAAPDQPGLHTPVTGPVQGGVHLGDGRSVAPHRDAPAEVFDQETAAHAQAPGDQGAVPTQRTALAAGPRMWAAFSVNIPGRRQGVVAHGAGPAVGGPLTTRRGRPLAGQPGGSAHRDRASRAPQLIVGRVNRAGPFRRWTSPPWGTRTAGRGPRGRSGPAPPHRPWRRR